jgi:hypothetical protein
MSFPAQYLSGRMVAAEAAIAAVVAFPRFTFLCLGLLAGTLLAYIAFTLFSMVVELVLETGIAIIGRTEAASSPPPSRRGPG